MKWKKWVGDHKGLKAFACLPGCPAVSGRVNEDASKIQSLCKVVLCLWYILGLHIGLWHSF